MREITHELRDRNCVTCMNCGRVFEQATDNDYHSNNCPCGKGWFNRCFGRFDTLFWRSQAATYLIAGKKPFSD